MSLSTWVQLFRNLFCVFKSLLPQSNFFQQLHFGDSSFYPLTITTSIELLIAPTQFAAVIFNCSSGYNDITNGGRDHRRANLWLKNINKVFLSEPFKSSSAEFLIIQQGLKSDRTASWRRIIIGYLELIFGFAFLFLVLNSLHIVGPTHPKPVIDALISMELGLAYILVVVMWPSFTEKVCDISRLSRLSDFAAGLTTKSPGAFLMGAMDSGFTEEELFLAFLSLDASYSPKWRCDGPDELSEKDLITEIQKEFRVVTSVFANLALTDSNGKVTKTNKSSLSDMLKKQKFEAQLQAPMELLYFILNFIAGYGYMLGILAYYIPEEMPIVSLGLQHYVLNIQNNNYWCKVLMFGMSHSDADWWGNLAGDIAWTVEPLLVLLQKPVTKFLVSLQFPEKQLPVKGSGKKPKKE